MLAAIQGVEIPDEQEDMGDDDLPEELLEMERQFRLRKEEAKAESGIFIPGLGYSVEP